jgi:hypothetical protein
MSKAPVTVRVTPAFLHYAGTMDGAGVFVEVTTAPFVTPGTVIVNPRGSLYRVMVPTGFTLPDKVSYSQVVVAAYRFGKRPVYTIEDEVAALRALILRAREAKGDCPFCRFDPCVDTCAVVRIRTGAWVAR